MTSLELYRFIAGDVIGTYPIILQVTSLGYCRWRHENIVHCRWRHWDFVHCSWRHWDFVVANDVTWNLCVADDVTGTLYIGVTLLGTCALLVTSLGLCTSEWRQWDFAHCWSRHWDVVQVTPLGYSRWRQLDLVCTLQVTPRPTQCVSEPSFPARSSMTSRWHVTSVTSWVNFKVPWPRLWR